MGGFVAFIRRGRVGMMKSAMTTFPVSRLEMELGIICKPVAVTDVYGRMVYILSMHGGQMN